LAVHFSQFCLKGSLRFSESYLGQYISNPKRVPNTHFLFFLEKVTKMQKTHSQENLFGILGLSFENAQKVSRKRGVQKIFFYGHKRT
jgi:hypothetical protein